MPDEARGKAAAEAREHPAVGGTPVGKRKGSAVDLSITPEPTDEEREALLAAFEQLLTEDERRSGSPYRSPWRIAGIEANTRPFDAYPRDR